MSPKARRKAAAVYRCENKNCPLGSLGTAGGLFTDGITKEQLFLLSGNADPDESEYGPGICPNCATEGAEYDPAVEVAASIKEQIAGLEAELKAVS